MKINWKKVAGFGFNIGKQLFPVLEVVESITKFNKLDGNEKQDLAFATLHDQLINGLLPKELKYLASDPRVEHQIRKMIDDAVELNNLIAKIHDESSVAGVI